MDQSLSKEYLSKTDFDAVVDNPCYHSELSLNVVNPPSSVPRDSCHPLPTPMARNAQSTMPQRMFSDTGFNDDEGFEPEPYSKLNSGVKSRPVLPGGAVGHSNVYDTAGRQHEYEELPYTKKPPYLNSGSGDSGIALEPIGSQSTMNVTVNRHGVNNNQRFTPGNSSQMVTRHKNDKKNDKIYDSLDTPSCRHQHSTSEYSGSIKGSCDLLKICSFVILLIIVLASVALSVYVYILTRSNQITTASPTYSASTENSSKQLSEALGRIEDLEQLYSDALERLDYYDTVIGQLVSNISELSTDIDSNDGNILTLQSDITDLSTNFSTLSSEVDGLTFTNLNECYSEIISGSADVSSYAETNTYAIPEGTVVMSMFCSASNGDVMYLKDMSPGYRCYCVGMSDTPNNFPEDDSTKVYCYLNIYLCPESS